MIGAPVLGSIVLLFSRRIKKRRIVVPTPIPRHNKQPDTLGFLSDFPQNLKKKHH